MAESTKFLEKIKSIVANIGYTSMKLVDVDQFDDKTYPNKVFTRQIEGSKFVGISYPYNDIAFNVDIHDWAISCCNMEFRLINSIIPTLKSGECYHTFPRFINIQRGSKNIGVDGKIQPGRTINNSAIVIRKSNSSLEQDPQLYISIEFNDTEFIDIKNYNQDLQYCKSVPVVDLAKINNITEFDVCFKLPDISKIDKSSVKYIVTKHYIDKHYEWVKKLEPIIVSVKKTHMLTINVVYV